MHSHARSAVADAALVSPSRGPRRASLAVARPEAPAPRPEAPAPRHPDPVRPQPRLRVPGRGLLPDRPAAPAPAAPSLQGVYEEALRALTRAKRAALRRTEGDALAALIDAALGDHGVGVSVHHAVVAGRDAGWSTAEIDADIAEALAAAVPRVRREDLDLGAPRPEIRSVLGEIQDLPGRSRPARVGRDKALDHAPAEAFRPGLGRATYVGPRGSEKLPDFRAAAKASAARDRSARPRPVGGEAPPVTNARPGGQCIRGSAVRIAVNEELRVARRRLGLASS